MRSASPERIRDECKKSRLVSVFFFFVNAVHSQRKYAIIRFPEHGTFRDGLHRLLFNFCFVDDSTYPSYHPHIRARAHTRVYSIKLVVVDTPRRKWFSGIRGKKIRCNQRKGQTKPLVGYLLHDASVCRENICRNSTKPRFWRTHVRETRIKRFTRVAQRNI